MAKTIIPVAGPKDRVTGHVLGDFSSADRTWLEPFIEAFASAVPLLVAGDDAGCMSKIALLTRPPKPAAEAEAG